MDMFLSATQVADITGIDASCLRSQARADPEKLGFPVTIVGNRVRFPTKPFCAFTGFTEEELQALLTTEAPTQEAANA